MQAAPQDPEQVATRQESQARQEADASAMLELMIQSTHQLDEILQRMGSSQDTSSQIKENNQFGYNNNTKISKRGADCSDDDDESDAEFEDCFSATSEGKLAPEDYVQVVRKRFQLSRDGIVVSRTSLDIHQLWASLEAVAGGLEVRFASCTRDTAFVFPSVLHSSSAGFVRAGLGSEEFATPLPVVAPPPPEYNVSYGSFLCRVMEAMVACDHLVPVERADAVVKLAFLLLEEQDERLRDAIKAFFPQTSTSQQQPIHWTQGNRTCEIAVRETHLDTQWGLLVQLEVNSLLRLRYDGQPGSSPLRDDGAGKLNLSSCTLYTVFLPKNHYLDDFGDDSSEFQASAKIKISLYEPIEKGTDVKEAKGSDGKTEEERPATQAEDISRNIAERTLPASTQLPEFLMASVWGEHDNTPMSDDKNASLPIFGRAKTSTFRKLLIETPLPRNRVVQAACSRFHTLFLNDMGLVFAYGHALDGALGLGHGWQGYVAKPTMVDFFLDNVVVVQQVACGGDHLVGAHSAAVSQEGGLFTWGVGIALGNGVLRSASTPQRINLPLLETAPTDTSTLSVAAVAAISCGSGFCVALTHGGQAFSWGKWSDGRLGLGRTPIIARSTRRHGGGVVRKQFQSFQLTPRRIRCILSAKVKEKLQGGGANDEAKFMKVSCGDAHCVGLTSAGELVTWGRGSSGQLGRGDVSDSVIPTKVFELSDFYDGKRPLCWRDVAAGENWSLALSSDGKVWSWGACGGAVLGHGLYGSQKNALLAETILQQHRKLLSQRKKSSATSSSPLPTLPRLKWMVPQPIPCFSTPDIRIRSLTAGVQHAAAISDTGDLYMWGENYSKDDLEENEPNILILTSLPRLVNSGQCSQEDTGDSGVADIGTHCVEHVVCGGRHVIAFTSGSFLARSMDKLYESITYQRSIETNKTNIFVNADLVLVVSGHRLLAHKLLLAQRSPILRELILEEEIQQKQLARDKIGENDGSTSRLELLLPRLRVDVARALVEFVYTDTFSLDPQGSYYLLRDVLRASKLFKLTGLTQLCRERLFSTSPSSLFDAADTPPGLEHIAEEDEELSDNNIEMDVDDRTDNGTNLEADSDKVIRTLNDDMKFALSDKAWADTVLVAEGHVIPVHSCMLVSRSEYFRALLAFQRSAAHPRHDRNTDGEAIVVNVEDSYAGIVRVLRFIYYDQVALPTLKRKGGLKTEVNSDEGNEHEGGFEAEASDQLLEDLVASDKYGLERMKRLCEHAVCVTVQNCLEVLAVAEIVHAAHLKQVAMRFVETHLAAVTARTEEFSRFQADFPLLLEELYSSLRDASRDEFLLREWHKAVGTYVTAQREEQERQWIKKSAEATFPWVPLSLAITFGTMYLTVMNVQEHEYPVVPASNLAAIAAIGGAIMMGWL